MLDEWAFRQKLRRLNDFYLLRPPLGGFSFLVFAAELRRLDVKHREVVVRSLALFFGGSAAESSKVLSLLHVRVSGTRQGVEQKNGAGRLEVFRVATGVHAFEQPRSSLVGIIVGDVFEKR